MPDPLYLQDPYQATFTAQIIDRVLREDGRSAVVLDRTAFFPGASGFPADRGSLNQAVVLEVAQRPEDGEILHVLSDEIWKNQVEGQIDLPHRLDLMRQHTAGHILADAVTQACGVAVAGIMVNEQAAFIELDRNSVTPAQIEQAETAANETVASNRAIRTATVTASQAVKIGLVPLSPEGRLLPGLASIRVISVEGSHPALCEALHVARTSEVGLIKVLGTERHGERWRVHFAASTRALLEFRRMDQSLAQVAASLNVSVTNVPQAITRLTSDLAAARQELETVRGSIAGFEAQALAASADKIGGVLAIRRVYAERDIATLRQLARLIVAKPGYAVMLGAGGPKAQLVFARSADVRLDMTAPIRIAAQVLNAQGGGQAALAESLPVRADEARVEAAIAKAWKWLQAQ